MGSSVVDLLCFSVRSILCFAMWFFGHRLVAVLFMSCHLSSLVTHAFLNLDPLLYSIAPTAHTRPFCKVEREAW